MFYQLIFVLVSTAGKSVLLCISMVILEIFLHLMVIKKNHYFCELCNFIVIVQRRYDNITCVDNGMSINMQHKLMMGGAVILQTTSLLFAVTYLKM